MGEAGSSRSYPRRKSNTMRMFRGTRWTAFLLASFVLVSCGQGATTTTAPTQPTTTSQPTSTTRPGETIEQFGFVRSLTGGTLVFDPAEMLTGDEALAAAREDGIIGADEDLPNDFYIRNPDQNDEWQISVGSAAEFVLIGLDASGALTDSPVSAAEFEALLSGSADSSGFYGFVPGDLPMALVLIGDTVTGGSQTYLP